MSRAFNRFSFFVEKPNSFNQHTGWINHTPHIQHAPVHFARSTTHTAGVIHHTHTHTEIQSHSHSTCTGTPPRTVSDLSPRPRPPAQPPRDVVTPRLVGIAQFHMAISPYSYVNHLVNFTDYPNRCLALLAWHTTFSVRK